MVCDGLRPPWLGSLTALIQAASAPSGGGEPPGTAAGTGAEERGELRVSHLPLVECSRSWLILMRGVFT